MVKRVNNKKEFLAKEVMPNDEKIYSAKKTKYYEHGYGAVDSCVLFISCLCSAL